MLVELHQELISTCELSESDIKKIKDYHLEYPDVEFIEIVKDLYENNELDFKNINENYCLYLDLCESEFEEQTGEEILEGFN